MSIRFIRSLVLDLYITQEDDVVVVLHFFRRGDVYPVGEVSPSGDGTTMFEFVKLGCADVPNDAWLEEAGHHSSNQRLN